MRVKRIHVLPITGDGKPHWSGGRGDWNWARRAKILVFLRGRVHGTRGTRGRSYAAEVDAASSVELGGGARLRLVGRGRDGGRSSGRGLGFGSSCGGGRGLGGRLGDGQRHASKFSSTGHAHAPGEGGAVSSALFPELYALAAVGTAAIALDLALSAGKAVFAGTGCGGSSSPFPGSGGGIVCGGVWFLGLRRLGGR
jgi:hypothetical protein